MHDFHQVNTAIKVMWMKKFFKEKTFLCKKYLEIHSGVSNILVLLQSNFTEKMIPNFDHLPDFYKNVIQNWKQVKYNNLGNNNEIRSQFIWYNSLISQKEHQYWFNKSLFQAGLWFIGDLFNEHNKIVPFEQWVYRGVSSNNYLVWRGLVTKLVQNLNIAREFRSNNGLTPKFNGIKLSGNKINIQDLNMKLIKKFLVLNTKLDSEFKNMAYYNTTFGQMDSDAWAKIYVLAHLLPVNNKVIELQYIILFRFVVTNKLLYQIPIKTTPNCPICEVDTQTIEHLFFECKKKLKHYGYKLLIFGTSITRGSLAKKRIMFLHSKNKASRKGYKVEC